MDWEKYFVALYRISVSVDPVVLIWTATFGICVAYFLLTKLVHTFFPSSRGSGSRASGDRRRRTSGSHERVGEGSQSQASPLARGRSGEAASQADKILGGGRIKNTDRAIIRPEIRERYEKIQKCLGSSARRVTLSTCGLIFEEEECAKLRHSATLLPDARNMIEALSIFTDVYLVTQVLDDCSMKNVTEALRESGICPGMVKSHKVLFCEKHVSKISIARQIEPDYHIDKDTSVNVELSRFKIKCLTELD